MHEKNYNLSYTQYCTLRGELHGEVFFSNDPSHMEITTGTEQDWIKKKWQRVPTTPWRRGEAGAQAALWKVSRSIFPGRFKPRGSKQGPQARQSEIFLRSKADVKAVAPWKFTGTVQSKPVPVLAEGRTLPEHCEKPMLPYHICLCPIDTSPGKMISQSSWQNGWMSFLSHKNEWHFHSLGVNCKHVVTWWGKAELLSFFFLVFYTAKNQL